MSTFVPSINISHSVPTQVFFLPAEIVMFSYQESETVPGGLALN